MGPGTFAFFDPKTYEIVHSAATCCPLVLVAASIRTNDKIGPFHGGYSESNKSKIINPKYINDYYSVEACTPQQSVISIGTTPYTSQTVGAVATLNVGALPSGTTYTAGTWPVSGGTGTGMTVLITEAGGVVQTATIVEGGAGYTVGDVLTIEDPGHTVDSDIVVATITPAIAADATCCKPFYCGETYYLRIDVKGSPALRALNHNAYQTLDAYTGCCPTDVPTEVDPTTVYISWASKIVENNYLKDFVMPVVFDFEGTPWYAPGTTVAPDGTAVTSAQWWTVYAPAAPWVDECTAGMRIYGAFVETKFGNCSFQKSDFYEKEPVRIFASLVDYTGDPCIFEGLCVYHECDGLTGQGFGETVIRDLILSEAYLQNFFHSDIRIREITGGDTVFNVIDRTGGTLYHRYFLLHSVPRFNNPSSTFDNDQYLLEIVTLAPSASFEAFMTTWLSSCTSCTFTEDVVCNPCIIAPDNALVP
jgi:hypothetical protein